MYFEGFSLVCFFKDYCGFCCYCFFVDFNFLLFAFFFFFEKEKEQEAGWFSGGNYLKGVERDKFDQNLLYEK